MKIVTCEKCKGSSQEYYVRNYPQASFGSFVKCQKCGGLGYKIIDLNKVK